MPEQIEIQFEKEEGKMKKFLKGTAFVLHTKNFLAFGLALKNGDFVVMKGSSFRIDQAKCLGKYRHGALAKRQKFIEEGIVLTKDGCGTFAYDHRFKSISDCTSTIMGSSRSGEMWVNAKGQTYPEWAAKKVVRKMKVVKPKPALKAGTNIKTKDGNTYVVSKVVENQDSKGVRYFEYLLMLPGTFGGVSKFLVPENQVLAEMRA